MLAPTLVRTLYHAAVRRRLDPELLQRAASALDAADLQQLACDVHDPLAFVPLLRAAREHRLHDAEARLRQLAREVLDAAGLTLLQPEDVLNTTPPAVQAAFTVFEPR